MDEIKKLNKIEDENKIFEASEINRTLTRARFLKYGLGIIPYLYDYFIIC